MVLNDNKEDEIGGTHSIHVWEEKRMQCFWGKTWRKETTSRPRYRWEDNIAMDL